MSSTSPLSLVDDILPRVHDLSDIELALLLCLVAHEHGILTTASPSLDSLVQELFLAATKTFGLTCAIIECSPQTSLDQFASGLLVSSAFPPPPPPPPSSSRNTPSPRPDYFVNNPRRSRLSSSSAQAPSASIANCVLAKNLHLAPRLVQIQVLELLRTGRILTRTSVHATPKRFILIPVLEASSPGTCPRLTSHLVDFFALAHWHDPEEGFLNLEEAESGGDEEHAERASTKSAVRAEALYDVAPANEPLISEDMVNQLAQLSQQVAVEVEVTRYQMNIVSFLRMHRAVRDGISPAATKHFGRIMRCLAPLHNLDYVTPALVGIAARKVYLHRIRITTPEGERSMQWGSRLEAVAALLKDVGSEHVVDEVLDTVTAPL
ncbi:hypothetical protein AAL_02843 [Moelleriella libera RCEF 2490]|uniref:magnesium chelatase n=1 Tax=Moelleriella libera RCEF 2490 TaxID=1081109 RepID=A0A168E1K0_9HYPO|nr:hypothetical protein AAL_02843 [Moelleriella libera RCEF 2490]